MLQAIEQRPVVEGEQLRLVQRAGVERQLDRLGDHRAGDDLGVVVVHPLGEEVAHAQELDDLRARVRTLHAVLGHVERQAFAGDGEVVEDALVVALRQAGEIRIASQIVEQVGVDGARDHLACPRRRRAVSRPEQSCQIGADAEPL